MLHGRTLLFIHPIHNHFLKNFCLFIQAALGLCCCVGFSLVVVSEGHSLVVVLRLLLVVASLAVEHVLSCPEACGTFPD